MLGNTCTGEPSAVTLQPLRPVRPAKTRSTMNRVLNKLLLPLAPLLVIACLLGGCAVPGSKQAALDDALRQYEAMVRWSEWDGALMFLAPESLEEHPVSELDIERLRQFRVTNYTIRSSAPYDEDNGLRQVVEIRVFNKNQATERSVIDNQDWKYNDEANVWLLHTGLPDVTQGR